MTRRAQVPAPRPTAKGRVSRADAGSPVSLGEAAYRRVREEIITCRLAPGSRLTERRLASDTGFGVSPIRAALTRLTQEGLIRTLPRKGYQVAPLTPKSIDDLFVVWEMVGPELIRLGLRQIGREQLEAAKAAFDELDGSNLGRAETAMRDIDVVNAAFEILASSWCSGWGANMSLTISMTRVAGIASAT